MLENRQQEEHSLLDDIVEDKMYLRTFFGKSPDYYEERYDRYQSGDHFGLFNPYAFFLGFFWMAYRKMYIELLALVGIITAFECILLFGLNIDNPVVDKATNLLWAFIIGFLANRFYLKKADRTIARAREMYDSAGQQLDYIEKEGGVSVIGPVIVGVLLILIFVGTTALNTYVSGYDYY